MVKQKKDSLSKIFEKIVDKRGVFRYNAPRCRETGRKNFDFEKIEIFLLTKIGC